nr:hypothetical protein CFP56_63465 [Quercus suber]
MIEPIAGVIRAHRHPSNRAFLPRSYILYRCKRLDESKVAVRGCAQSIHCVVPRFARPSKHYEISSVTEAVTKVDNGFPQGRGNCHMGCC